MKQGHKPSFFLSSSILWKPAFLIASVQGFVSLSQFRATRGGRHSSGIPLLFHPLFSSSPEHQEFAQSESGLFLPENEQQNYNVMELSSTYSKSGVSYRDVMDGIDILFPPTALEQRTALSRKDGYWPYIHKGDDPPQAFVYGEYDVGFLAQLLDRAQELSTAQEEDWSDKVFVDMGSGTGRLVLAAAALHNWKLCRGIELLESIHLEAEENLKKCRVDGSGVSSSAASTFPQSTPATNRNNPSQATQSGQGGENSSWENEYIRQYKNSMPQNDWLSSLSSSFDDDVGSEPQQQQASEDDSTPIDGTPQEANEISEGSYALPQPDEKDPLPLAPIEFVCGSMDDPYSYFGDADCVFIFSSAMPQETLSMFSKAVGRQCKPGCIVITTEYQIETEGYIEPYAEDASLPYGSYKLELLEECTGQVECTGGISTAYFYRVIESLWEGEDIRRTKPVISVEEQAFRVAQQLESGELTANRAAFKRNLYNNMVFLGLPESWLPKL